MKKIFSFLCAVALLNGLSVSGAALPGKSGAMKRSKDYEIYHIVGTAYGKCVAELTEFQTQYTASKRFGEATRIQEEIQRMTNLLKRLEGMGKMFVKKIPGDAKSFGGHRYKVYSGKVTWYEAKFRCEELGGHLAIVDNEEENKFLSECLGQTSLRSNAVFIGATDEVKEGNWFWVNGKKMDLQK